MSMRLFIGGMRGSQPVTGAAFEQFGGDTTSLLLVGSQGERLVLDAGTGMQAVAKELAATGPGEVAILFSHYHLDHMVGLTMNPLFYQAEWSFKFVGPSLADGNVRQAVTGVLAPPYWPVSWQQMNARLEFPELDDEGFDVGKVHVRGCSMPHPGGCVAYRIDDSSSASLVYATDIEWRERTPSQETAFVAMCTEPKPADLLVIDAHFAEADAGAFVGWGHTCWEDGLQIAESVGIRHVLLGHHAPEASDRALNVIEQRVKKRMPDAELARSGRWLTIDGKLQSC